MSFTDENCWSVFGKLQIAKSRSLRAAFLKGGNPATSRHTSHTLRLLPSGPDRVHELLLREDQAPIDSFSKRLASKSEWIIKHPSNHCKPFPLLFEQLWSKCLSFIQTITKSQVNSPFTCDLKFSNNIISIE